MFSNGQQQISCDWHKGCCCRDSLWWQCALSSLLVCQVEQEGWAQDWHGASQSKASLYLPMLPSAPTDPEQVLEALWAGDLEAGRSRGQSLGDFASSEQNLFISMQICLTAQIRVCIDQPHLTVGSEVWRTTSLQAFIFLQWYIKVPLLVTSKYPSLKYSFASQLCSSFCLLS